ncbi:MAG: stage 0 sporulation protein [Clostridiales Family XIII bacterium]|jgi:cell fate regulator YaaT (PSP1 superfamily)|nr:stage 0 sporulation protein [Clostridiales Family XIII bacterium]
MVRAVNVSFKKAGKLFYFDTDGLELNNGDNVVVETGRGISFGTVKGPVFDLSDGSFAKSLKKVMRKATPEDEEKNAQNLAKRDDAMDTCREIVQKHDLDMKLIDAEYTFDGSKIVFYFTSEKRVDFRELVKELAGVFRRRIEMRQVGVRDEAKMLSGIGNCGRCFCCSGWLQDFEPVSIKMAKVQNLSLNPAKISGSCGRLMCCLKFENDVYQELRKGMPGQGEVIDTPAGRGRVMESNILMNTVKVRLIEEERTKDSFEKLSSDTYAYAKDEIRRLKNSGKYKTKRDSFQEEIKEAIDDEIITVLD